MEYTSPAPPDRRVGKRVGRLWSAILLYAAVAANMSPSQTRLTFEVATIKPAVPLDLTKLTAGLQHGQVPRLGVRVEGSRAEYIYLTLQDLIVLAYGAKPYQVTGPEWIGAQHFDIFARIPSGASRNDAPRMLQALLEDRFRLALHRELKQNTELVLEVGKDGPKLKESPPSALPIDTDESPRAAANRNGGFTMNMGAHGTIGYITDPLTHSMTFETSQITMAGFAEILTRMLRANGGNQQVKDMTGLTGKYHVAITFSMADLSDMARPRAADVGDAPASAASDPGVPAPLLNAVRSMGLRLGSRKAMIEQLVIDHVEKMPIEN